MSITPLTFISVFTDKKKNECRPTGLTEYRPQVNYTLKKDTQQPIIKILKMCTWIIHNSFKIQFSYQCHCH